MPACKGHKELPEWDRQGEEPHFTAQQNASFRQILLCAPPSGSPQEEFADTELSILRGGKNNIRRTPATLMPK